MLLPILLWSIKLWAENIADEVHFFIQANEMYIEYNINDIVIINRVFQNNFHYGLVTLLIGNIADVANCFPRIKSALYKNVLTPSTKESKSWTKKGCKSSEKRASHRPKKKKKKKKNKAYIKKMQVINHKSA